jgi:YidC/Oxa1 family membrane protein insertase
MFTTLIVQPIFNLLVLIYALLPGHNFGLAIILFTILVRLLMWPLVKKQLHHAKAMRELQPELKRIKKETKGDRQKESMMLMELYKERQINPFSSIGIIIIQIPILIGLYIGLKRIVDNPQELVDFTYPFIRELGTMRELAADITKFDSTLFGVVDLTRPALAQTGGIYWPAMFIVIGSAVSQYFQSRQLMPKPEDGRGLKHILRDAKAGKQADQTEVSAAVSRSMSYFIPFLIFIFTVGLAAALPLYWLVSGLTAYLQQAKILKQDESELKAVADKAVKKDVIEGEIVAKKLPKNRRRQGSKVKKRKKK